MLIPAIPLAKALVLAGAAFVTWRQIAPHSFSEKDADRLDRTAPGLCASLRGRNRLHGSGRMTRRYRLAGLKRWIEVDAAAIFQVRVRMSGGVKRA